MALYRKWRPSVFSDVVGQEHITKILKSEIMQGSVSHAYLFCGSRGTGKTTCAKILAKAISCENPKDGDPCGECEKCRNFDNSFDIVEMDAASNNGVEDVRDLREKINFLPIEMKRRVYIIDEVHMLSVGAFNALLKTLEEPPEHVMFILATTELNKIPATILSRCKRFDFHRISPDDIAKRLRYISDEEKIGIDDEALRLISSLATGAMRDALSMLELFVGRQDITREVAESSLGVVGNEIVLKLLRSIADKDSKGALETVSSAYNSSKDPGIMCSELGNMLRDLLVMKYASNSVSQLLDAGSDIINTLRDVEDKFTPERLLYCSELVENASNKLARPGLSSRTVLEIAVMRMCDSKLSTSPEALLERISALEAAPRAVAYTAERSTPVIQERNEENVPSPIVAPKQENAVKEEVPLPPEPKDELEQLMESGGADNSDNAEQGAAMTGNEMIAYGDVLEAVKAKSMMLYSLISDSMAYLDTDTVTVKTNSMAILMISSNDEMLQLLTNEICKTLGYTVNVLLAEK